jgi:hypothetical protein
MLSERKTKIELALDMQRNVINLAFDHLFDDNDIPFESKLKEFDAFLNELLRNYCAMHSVSKNMHGNLKAMQELPPLPPA